MSRNYIVQDTDIAQSAATSTTVAVGSTQVLPTRLGKPRRVQFVITNLSPTTIYVSKGDTPATADTGVPLQQNQSWSESDDGGYDCYQGAIMAIGTASSTVAILETIGLNR